MGAFEEGGKVATGVIESLKSQPLAIALLVINILFLGTVIYVLREVAATTRARELHTSELLADLARRCIVPLPHQQERTP
jgi:hypothetical protein